MVILEIKEKFMLNPPKGYSAKQIEKMTNSQFLDFLDKIELQQMQETHNNKCTCKNCGGKLVKIKTVIPNKKQN
jgi:hypothetical protein